MARQERAQDHYDKQIYPFNLTTEDNNEVATLDMTTRQAFELGEALAKLGTVVAIEACHPEFLGWTCEQIAANLEDE